MSSVLTPKASQVQRFPVQNEGLTGRSQVGDLRRPRGSMTKDERAWRALEGAAKRLNEAGPSLLRSVGRELKKEAQRLGVRALDRIVSRFAGHPVHTEASTKLAEPRPKALAEPTPEARPSRPPFPRPLDSTPPCAPAKPASW